MYRLHCLLGDDDHHHSLVLRLPEAVVECIPRFSESELSDFFFFFGFFTSFFYWSRFLYSIDGWLQDGESGCYFAQGALIFVLFRPDGRPLWFFNDNIHNFFALRNIFPCSFFYFIVLLLVLHVYWIMYTHNNAIKLLTTFACNWLSDILFFYWNEH